MPTAPTNARRRRSVPRRLRDHIVAPWHFLNFLPEPQGHGSFRPTADQSTLAGVFGPDNDRIRPAPTIDGSLRAVTGLLAGVSAGPISTAPSTPLPDVSSSTGMSSRMPSALYFFVALCGGGGGGGAGGSNTSCTLRKRSLNVL